MSSIRKARIVSAFDRADRYDDHARVQKIVAGRLAKRIAALPPDTRMPALELGCGTGFLTDALLACCPGLPLLASDIAPSMVDRARARLGDRSNVTFAVVDAEDPPAPPPGGWGLIASSLAFQWLERPSENIRRLAETLAPGGCLAIATLASGSFAEWRSALAVAGLSGRTRDYPDTDALVRDAPVGFRLSSERYELVEQHESALSFLRGLKAIGAATAWDQGTPSPALRGALAAFEANGCRVTYAVAEIVLTRDPV